MCKETKKKLKQGKNAKLFSITAHKVSAIKTFYLEKTKKRCFCPRPSR
jgi:hypothetical protein